MKRGSLLLRELVTPTETQVAISNACGVSQQAVSSWVKGTAKPLYEKKLILRDRFGIPIEAWDEEVAEAEAPTGGEAA